MADLEITYREYSDEDVIKALECCSKDGDGDWCSGCPFAEQKCAVLLPQKALDLIKRLKAQNEKWQELSLKQEDTAQMLAKEKQDIYDELIQARAEIEEKSRKLREALIFPFVADFKTLAVKEFAERLKDAFPEGNRDTKCPALYYDDYCYIIDELAEEMTEGEK